MAVVNITDVGRYGLITDKPSHLLPPQAWNYAKNVRFSPEGVEKMLGHSSIFSPSPIIPAFISAVPGASTIYWVYMSLTKAYVYENGIHTNITRQSAGVDANYIGTVGNTWQATFLGGVPIFNNAVNVPQYWPALNPATRLSNLTNWPTNASAKVFRAFGSYLVGINITEAGTNKPHMVWWSHKTQPGTIPSSWDYTDPAVDAGRFELTDILGGELVDGVLLGDKLILYKKSSTHAMRFVGGNDIFGADLLLSTAGSLEAKCITPFKKGTRHFVVSEDDVLTHTGTRDAESIVDYRTKRSIFDLIDRNNLINCFTFENPQNKEVWFAFPETGATNPTVVAIWNYNTNTWTLRDFDGVSAASGVITDSSGLAWSALTNTWDESDRVWGKLLGRILVFTTPTTPYFFQLDNTLQFNQQPFMAEVSRTGLAVVEKDNEGNLISDIAAMKLYSRLWPKVTGTDSLEIAVGVQDNYNDPVTWLSTQVFNPLTDEYIDFNAAGRLLALAFRTNTDHRWRLEGYDLEVTKIAGL